MDDIDLSGTTSAHVQPVTSRGLHSMDSLGVSSRTVHHMAVCSRSHRSFRDQDWRMPVDA